MAFPGLPRRRLDQFRQPAGNAMAPGSSATVRARYVIVSGPGGGTFAYAGTPGPGNPPISWLTDGGLVDPYGNVLPSTMGVEGSGTFSAGNSYTYPAGTVAYAGPVPSVNGMVYSLAAAAFRDSAGGTVISGELADESGAALLDESAAFLLDESGSPVTGNSVLAGITSYGPNPSGSGYIASNMNAGIFTNWTAVTMAGPWTLVSQLPSVQADASVIGPITPVTPSRVSKVWQVPANDASTGTVYRLTAYGFGVWGNPAQVLQFNISSFGFVFFATQIGAAALPPGAFYSWEVETIFQVINAATGTVNLIFRGTLTQNGTNVLQPTSIAFTTANSSGTGISFAIASNITLQASYGAATGAPTITGIGSVFERLGQAP